MERKKLIRRIATLALIVFIVSILILIAQDPYRNWQWKNHLKRMDDHLESLTANYQQFLSKTAEKIKSLPVDPGIIAQARPEILQDRPRIRLYLWMSDMKGRFIFGAPRKPLND